MKKHHMGHSHHHASMMGGKQNAMGREPNPGRAHGQYENEVEMPHVPSDGHMLQGWGMHDFKGEADSIAYGQAGGPGCMSDEKKMHSQFKDYHWD